MKGGGKSPLGYSPVKSPLKSPMKATNRSSSPRRNGANSPKKLSELFRFDRKEKDQQGGDRALLSPTSVTMQNSFLIQNADQSFDLYYNQHLKKRKQMTMRG